MTQRVALVTGASRGIGAATVSALAAAGHKDSHTCQSASSPGRAVNWRSLPAVSAVGQFWPRKAWAEELAGPIAAAETAR